MNKYKKRKTLLIIIFGIFLMIIIWQIIIHFEKYSFFLFGEKQYYKGEFFKLVLSVLGGILVLYTLWLNARRTRALEYQNDLNRKGHVDDRFKNAIEHLGSENTAIILGGIYALHRIAVDDIEYRQTVFDILSSFLRERTGNKKRIEDLSSNERKKFKPDIIIQTIVNLLLKKYDTAEYIYRGYFADLEGGNLVGINLYGTNLRDASLNRAHLQDSFLRRAHLEGADLCNAHLEGADLCEAHLEDVDLSEAHLEGADLRKCHLEGADLSEAHLEGADLSEAHLEGADLSEAHLEGANLRRAHLEGTDLWEAHLESALLNYAHLEGADLTDTHLEGADLNNAHLEGISSSIEYLNYSFEEFLQKKIGFNSEFKNVSQGNLSSELAEEIIQRISEKDFDEEFKTKFKENILEGTSRNSRIKGVAITGILTKEKTEEIIQKYEKAKKSKSVLGIKD